ncbi:MAG: deoxyguanosinetriphosphate triphosphohydrolase [Desulfosarcina sp.]|nr:deoxyguanosinetriphosphate triphosphohydrolase [Desulfobacterales bacterium]
MTIRKTFENREKSFMSPVGCLSAESKGRAIKEKACPIRTPFQVDRDRIVYSHAFRRLKYKTQVFLSPLGDFYRTRLTHTLEVAQISRTIARAMFLNEDLVEAIALGHDLGHPPFGHSGENCLQEIYSPDFSHNKQSLRLVDLLENNGKGLNLTHEVRDGILKHSKGYGKVISSDPEETANTVEGRIVRIGDIMAYLNHDLDDAIKSGVIKESMVPDSCKEVLGNSYSERATTMVKDLVFSSRVSDGKMHMQVSDDVSAAMKELRKFLYDKVYRSNRVHREFVKSKKILSELYTYFLENQEELFKRLESMDLRVADKNRPVERVACDLISSITDRYALYLYEKIFFPSSLV